MRFEFNFKKTIIFCIAALLIISGGLFAMQKYGILDKGRASLVNPVSASEIYPLFFCPCCGQPLDKKNICCEMAQERIDYIDSLAGHNLSEEDIILSYIKQYGIDSFLDEQKQKEYRQKLIAQAPDQRPAISFAEVARDLGDVSRKNGVIYTTFDFKNSGSEDLVMSKLDSSCGCTSASIVFEGKEGPRFAMPGHGTENPVGWSLTIPPGKGAQLKIYYDPNVHKDLIGPVIREVYIFSNDPIDPKTKIMIELNQVQ